MKRMIVRWAGFLSLLILVGIPGVHAQVTSQEFGKNRIQYRDFDWQYLSGENFDVYYYDGRRAVATEVLNYVEGEFDRITDLIGYPPYFKTKLFLYNSLTDLRQSNVGLNNTNNVNGGETEFVRPYVEVANLGNSQQFREELLYRVSRLMVDEMMFGGNLKDIFQSALLMNLPDWFVEGAALYVAKGWTPEMDDFIRQAITLRKARRISAFEGEEAALVGQSIWNFIAERYGKSSIGNILNYTRVTRNEERSILLTLGISFRHLISEWQNYYTQIRADAAKSYQPPPEGSNFSPSHRKFLKYTTVKISPDGQNLAFAENDRGRYSVKVRSLTNGDEIAILAGGSRAINQQVDYSMPILAWADAHTLGVIAVRRGKYVFWLYDLSSRTKLPRELDRFSNIRSMDFSGNGRLVVLSADLDGRNDLFLISSRRDRTRRLTNDASDDLDPTFIPGGNRIVFSSNRATDSLRARNKVPLFELGSDYNLFVYDLDTTTFRLERLTNAIGRNYAPVARNDDSFFYLSDQRGIVNLFRFNRSTGIYSQMTNYESTVMNYDLNFETSTLAFITTDLLVDDIYVQRDFNADRQIFTPPTRRREVQQMKTLHDRRKQEEDEYKNLSIKDLINARKQEMETVRSDTVQLDLDSIAIADSVIVIDTMAVDSLQAREHPGNGNPMVNTDDYVFDDEVAKEDQPSQTFLNRYMRARERSRILGPFPYESKFSADNIVTSPVIDPLRGFGIRLETQMNDMLENYRFFGGVMSSLDFRSGDAYAEFEYLPEFIDFSSRIERKAIKWEQPFSEGNIFDYSLLHYDIGASVPIDERTRVTIKPFAALTRSVNQGVIKFPSEPPSEKPINRYYAGLRVEVVYDNSITTGSNLIEGTRAKIAFNTYQNPRNPDLNFSQVNIDLRHYQKIYKEIVLAFHGFAGTFFGHAPKKYLVGGMDNWAFSNTRVTGRTSAGEPNPLGDHRENQDILFVEYVTNLRGFDYGTLFGNNALLFNGELRVPLIRALTNNNITSNFFRNLQFTAFYDIGTSWTGALPFDSELSSVVRVVPEMRSAGPFSVEIKEYLNPWLYSYGVGMRTMLLGYYTKLDLAWPVENFKVKDPRLMVTLGYDF